MTDIRYDRGDLLRVTAQFTDPDGDPTDPDTVTFLTLCGGEEASYVHGTDSEVTKTETGTYVALIDLDQTGNWWIRVEATGDGQAAAEHRIRVVSAFD